MSYLLLPYLHPAARHKDTFLFLAASWNKNPHAMDGESRLLNAARGVVDRHGDRGRLHMLNVAFSDGCYSDGNMRAS